MSAVVCDEAQGSPRPPRALFDGRAVREVLNGSVGVGGLPPEAECLASAVLEPLDLEPGVLAQSSNCCQVSHLDLPAVDDKVVVHPNSEPVIDLEGQSVVVRWEVEAS